MLAPCLTRPQSSPQHSYSSADLARIGASLRLSRLSRLRSPPAPLLVSHVLLPRFSHLSRLRSTATPPLVSLVLAPCLNRLSRLRSPPTLPLVSLVLAPQPSPKLSYSSIGLAHAGALLAVASSVAALLLLRRAPCKRGVMEYMYFP